MARLGVVPPLKAGNLATASHNCSLLQYMASGHEQQVRSVQNVKHIHSLLSSSMCALHDVVWSVTYLSVLPALIVAGTP